MVLPAVLVAVLVTTTVLVGTRERPLREAISLAVIALCLIVFFACRARFGAAAVEQRLAGARAAWATQRGWRAEAVGDAEPNAAELVLPRLWRVEYVVARARHSRPAGEERVETWRLRGPMGSRPRITHREVVSVAVPTGPARFAVATSPSGDPGLDPPDWTRGGRRWSVPQAEPAWAQQVRDLVTAHEDLPLTVAVGNDRVLLVAYDDPRLETVAARLALAQAVAAVVRPPRT